MSPADGRKTEGPPPGFFATTRWSLVLEAREETSPRANESMAALCETYWPPLYAYVRGRGYPVEEAQDLTQEFFARLLEKDFLKDVRQEKGRFRSFLLACMKHFLANEWDKRNAQKRGSGRAPISLDFAVAEGGLAEPSHEVTPEKMYERQWALTLLDRVLKGLREDYASSGKAVLFDGLKPFLVGDEKGVPYKELGEELHLAEGAVKVAVHRFRKRYREALRMEISQTLENVGDIEDEMRYLFAALRG